MMQLADRWLLPEIDGGVIRLKVQDYDQRGLLTQEIQNRRKEIAAAIEQFEALHYKPPYFLEEVKSHLSTASLIPVRNGRGGTYLLGDAWLIRLNDEDPLCLHNPGGAATPFNDYPRPLYRSASIEALCYEVAELLNLSSITPELGLMVIESEQFNDIADGLPDDQAGRPVKRKLCSVQKYLADSISVKELLAKAHPPSIDPAQFEQCVLYTLIIGEMDGNTGNYRLCGDHSLKKVDQTMAFPLDNQEVSHHLHRLKEIDHPLSEWGRELLSTIPTEKIVERMRFWHFSKESIEAFLERCRQLQQLASKKSILLSNLSLNR